MPENGTENRQVWRFLMGNMWDKDLIEELKGRHVLHWNYRCYEQLPLELLVFGLHVEEIYLKGNCLFTLPEWLNSLSNLTNIYLEGNRLQRLPPSIGSCHMLDTLDLQDNHLTEVPDEFCNLKNLTTLNLRGNRIRKLPKKLWRQDWSKCNNWRWPNLGAGLVRIGQKTSLLTPKFRRIHSTYSGLRGFGNLKALAVLNMASNTMSVLPDCICDLRSLQELILDNNELKALPKKIVQLPNLCYLSVSNNRLEHLPLMFFVSHASITFTHNPKLNYVQYELGCDLSRNSFVATDFDDEEAWRMDITGCSTGSPEKSDVHVCIKIIEENTVLKLPREFRKVHHHDKTAKLEVPSLFELSLRQSYETIAQSRENSQFIKETVDWTWNIPPIGQLLNSGPTARCSNVECSDALFTEAVVWAMRMPVSNGEGPTRTLATLLFFCSAQCARAFGNQHEKENSLRVNWTLV